MKIKYIRQIAVIAIVDVLASLFYLDVPIEGFRLTFAVVFYPLLLNMYHEVNPIIALVFAGIAEILSRSWLLAMLTGDFTAALMSSYQEIPFYFMYGLVFYLLYTKSQVRITALRSFFIFFLCDFTGNLFEFITRVFTLPGTQKPETVQYIVIAALIRAAIAVIVIRILRHFELLAVREEHEDSNKNLMSIATDLKAETYFLDMNLSYIENVMNDAYTLYGEISSAEIDQSLKKLSLSIAKDVHEIKKDYIRVIRGIDEIMDRKLKTSKMKMKDVFDILRESTERILKHTEKDIDIFFDIEDNYYIEEHFSFMSVFRNLINNAIEAVEKKEGKGLVEVRQYSENGNDVFTVRDNGEGIKEKNLKYIFTPRFSTKFNENTGSISRGIGLTLVKSVVENKFGGEITVESEYGAGTVFKISIPKGNLGG
ncbi:two-component system, sensor histidine kinase YcbA [Dethiosulfatibacter aminovorans DSM 17477]|uniref:histidine kinase n=1 Tax=Dethiosulfatibacter aminovorans DSM 17477 TaxID=1121476 RepID=A0A1M6BTZ6_9FIRM|nr:ATP-binding protein [Dethiosulfatibacter aminovorans]SHI51978.1 two-component system, sensor histidine kinase YcbA [Dethiosulfatibacter aminovorans DSM 17477]